MRIKICGLTNPSDAEHAARCGADFLGIIATESPRRVDLGLAREIARVRDRFPVRVVGVFAGQSREHILKWVEEVPLDVLQLHPEDGAPWPLPVMRTFRLKGPVTPAQVACDRFSMYEIFVEGLKGGTGRTFPVEWLEEQQVALGPYFLAGGLSPSNVAERIRRLRPFGVDVSSGVESSPGVKDPEAVRKFIEEARRAAVV